MKTPTTHYSRVEKTLGYIITLQMRLYLQKEIDSLRNLMLDNLIKPGVTWIVVSEKGREASSHVMCRVFSTCTEARAHPHGSDPPAASPGVRTGHFTNDQNTTREPESDALPKI